LEIPPGWLEFSSQMQAKGVSSDHGDALAAVLPEFKQHLFTIIRCINANFFWASDVGKTDEQRIQELEASGFRRHDNASDGNNCLTDSLMTALRLAGYMAEPADRKKVRDEIRALLVQDPVLHPSAARGRKQASAFLEHCRHAKPIITELVWLFWVRPFPGQGFTVQVHARYDTDASPAGSLVVPRVCFGIESRPSMAMARSCTSLTGAMLT